MPFSPPDWRDELAYPSPKVQPDLSYWAWQFLRRNPDYQAEWTAYAASLDQMASRVPALGPYVQVHCSAHPDAGSMNAWRVCAGGSPPFDLLWSLMQQPEIKAIQSSGDGGPGLVGHQARALGMKWGLEELQHPGADELHRSNRFLNNGGTAYFVGEVANVDDSNFAVMQFDLRLPIKSLEGQFRTLLNERQRRIDAKEIVAHGGRPERGLMNYTIYVRVLDAISAGATGTEVAALLAPQKDKDVADKDFLNWKKAAIELRDKTYRTIPAHSTY